MDESLLRSVRRYLDRHEAPREPRLVVDFYFGLAGWDFGAAAAAADALLEVDAHEQGWIPREELAEGAVIAKLRIGDVTGARSAHDRLTSETAVQAGAFRLQLLRAYLDAFSNGSASAP